MFKYSLLAAAMILVAVACNKKEETAAPAETAPVETTAAPEATTEAAPAAEVAPTEAPAAEAAPEAAPAQ